MAKHWSDSEIEAIVGNYFAMLEREEKGIPYVKAQCCKELQLRVDRTKGSIERKHQNISSVLNVLGLPFIDGYKPLSHYQGALFEAVEAHLKQHRHVHAFLAGETLTADQHAPSREEPPRVRLAFEEPPEPPAGPPPGQSLPEDIQQIIRRFEQPAERDARNRWLGEAGEKLVFDSERSRLQEAGRDDLAKEVRWVAKDHGDGFGYDIVSFAGQGADPHEERLLEVKTTTASSNTPFYITSNELEVSKSHQAVFRVVRLYDFRRQARAYCLSPPLEARVRLTPEVYRAGF